MNRYRYFHRALVAWTLAFMVGNLCYHAHDWTLSIDGAEVRHGPTPRSVALLGSDIGDHALQLIEVRGRWHDETFLIQTRLTLNDRLRRASLWFEPAAKPGAPRVTLHVSDGLVDLDSFEWTDLRPMAW